MATHDGTFHLYRSKVVKRLIGTDTQFDHVAGASIDPMCLRPATTTDVNGQVLDLELRLSASDPRRQAGT